MKHDRRSTLIAPTILVTLFILGACSSGLPVSLPQALQPNTPTPTSTPTITPSPTPSPTPTPLPAVVLDQAERDLRNGDWDSAALAFQQAMLDPGATDDERVEAQIGLAHASLRQGDFTTAQAALDAFLSQYPTHPRASSAYFLRGEAKMGLNDWAGAIADYQAYLYLKPGVIDSYLYERIADCYLVLGQTDQALATYSQSLDAPRPLVSQLQLREKVAQINRSLGNTEGAVAQYQAILAVAQNNSYRASIEFMLAQALLEGGQTDAAYEQLNHVFLTYPRSYEALSALRALREAGYEVDQYQRGVVNFINEQYDIAIEAFYNYLAATPIREVRPDAHLYIARSYRALGNIQAALSELQALISRYAPTDGDAWGNAWLEMADIYAASGDPATAYTLYEQLAAEHPEITQAADALYQAGTLAASQGDQARAIGYYQRLAANFPADPRASQGLFDVGLAAYRSGDLATAEAMFNSTASLPSTERPAASYFWLGKTLQAAGRFEEANLAFNNAITADGGKYYALRAADLLAGRPPFSLPPAFLVPSDPEEGRTEAEAWIVQTFGLSEAPPLAANLRADLATDSRMIRGSELWELGLVTEAKQDLESVRKDFENDVLASYQLAIYFRDIGLYRSSLLAARRVFTLANVNPLDGPIFLARLTYPTYFADLLLNASQQYNLDPFMVFALVWQESLFEGFATSTASAQGLMQIWPPTGEDIAAALNWPNYRPSDLHRPYVNVAFGTWLLRDELDRFDGDTYAALAAYNAGTGRAGGWQQASGGDPDLFVEVIHLQEPQTYIQRIYEHYMAYRMLYGAP
jgi:soluble lytic murein transglycosylase